MATKGLNKVMLIGNLGQEPKIYETNTGGKIASISLATKESWKNKTTGMPEEKTTWHSIVFYNKLAEICASLLQKGAKIFVEGKIENRKYTDKEGIERMQTQIVANEMQLLDAKKSANDANGNIKAEQVEDDDYPF